MSYPHKGSKKHYLRNMIRLGIAMTLSTPAVLMAQANNAPEVEEVVVTGSYIRNSAFAQNSPVATISQDDLYQSGAPSMANYIRDLSFTQNTNTVQNVLATASGGQSGVGTTFNLRGLGENSTLTMMDGVRSIDNSVTALIPDIAIARVEVVLDGGSALYGSDAVAGVVNMIPIKRFDGVRVRAYYQTPEEGGMEEGNLSLLWGKSFTNGVNYVGAFDARKRSHLGMYERPREWEMADGSSGSGNPGTYRRINNANPVLGGQHRGTISGGNLPDPSCGTFNQGLEDRTKRGSIPSGIITGTGNNRTCWYNYTTTYPYARAMTEYNLYQNVTWEATDWLQLEATGNWNYLLDAGTRGVVTALNPNNRTVLYIPASHPANTFGFDVVPYLWRPAAGLGTMPDWISEFGETKGGTDTSSNRMKLGARFDLSETWTGYAYYSRQESKAWSRAMRNNMNLKKLQQALMGKGGVNNDLWFNPFGSADPRSPLYVKGKTDNSPEIMAWMWDDISLTTDRDYLDIAEVTITGELFDLPAGAVSMATGYQWRDTLVQDFAHPLSAIGNNYNVDITTPVRKDAEYVSQVRAVFLEMEVPILESLTAQGAVRHEQFTDFGLESTTPKVALRWEAMDGLALRASWGKSFLAPTPEQARPFIPNELCGEAFSGNDPFFNASLIGSSTCQAGNPNLAPETSTIKNFGFTYEGIDNLSISMDYQSVSYVDRIRTLDDTDTVYDQFREFLQATGRTEATYNPANATDRAAATAYLRSIAGPGNPVQRDPADMSVDTIFRQAQNIASVYIDLLDAKARYIYDAGNWGTFTTTLEASYYLNYEYEDNTGVLIDALGMQNAQTGIVPPLPDIKGSLRLGWYKGNHSGSLSANYRSGVVFDDRPVDRYGDGWLRMVDRKIDAETITNAQYSYTFEQYFDSTITLSGGVSNLFDIRPQRLPIIGGFESRLSTPWGRQVWLSLDWQPGA
ncbi:MAG: TonB-dependent receptor [Gammaproteobacteria bacterium]|nr:TonB-dependent receptor [Gammaproteobacteria bacterium]MDP2348789.1 TonB-dependent receptor [Gammaproteobacteria bacterium]